MRIKRQQNTIIKLIPAQSNHASTISSQVFYQVGLPQSADCLITIENDDSSPKIRRRIDSICMNRTGVLFKNNRYDSNFSCSPDVFFELLYGLNTKQT